MLFLKLFVIAFAVKVELKLSELLENLLEQTVKHMKELNVSVSIISIKIQNFSKNFHFLMKFKHTFLHLGLRKDGIKGAFISLVIMVISIGFCGIIEVQRNKGKSRKE